MTGQGGNIKNVSKITVLYIFDSKNYKYGSRIFPSIASVIARNQKDYAAKHSSFFSPFVVVNLCISRGGGNDDSSF